MNEIMATPDKGIPRGILAGASCVTVIPSYKKGAFVVGAQYGQGVATCRTPNGWSAPVFVQLAGGSFGWQIGGQSTDLVLIAMNQNGMQDMLKNKVKLGADAAASAGPVGRNAQAGTDWKLNAEFLTYSRSKGLFAGLDLDGTVLSQNSGRHPRRVWLRHPLRDRPRRQRARSGECAALRSHRGPLLRQLQATTTQDQGTPVNAQTCSAGGISASVGGLAREQSSHECGIRLVHSRTTR